MLPLGLVGLIGCLLAFSLPDIDHENSKISRKLPIISWFTTLMCKHRGITHSIVGLSIPFMIAVYLPFGMELAYGIVIGYVSHLFGDMCTPRGIPLFWPFMSYYRIPVLCNLGIITKIILVLVMGYFIVDGGNFQNIFNNLLTFIPKL
jgi:membrane-bound metal-dependent hydrolase YbcI (DUF457 family)